MSYKELKQRLVGRLFGPEGARFMLGFAICYVFGVPLAWLLGVHYRLCTNNCTGFAEQSVSLILVIVLGLWILGEFFPDRFRNKEPPS